jgi:predicted phage terminase large subunit-like protein
MGIPATQRELTINDYAFSRLLPYVKAEMPNYIVGRHHKVIAHYLQKLESGEVTRLAIFMPPRHGKTLLASQFFSSWYLGRNPTHEIIFASYAQDRSDDVGRSVRNAMLTDFYKQTFENSHLRSDAKGARKFSTVQGGSFFTTSWTGAATGRGANCASQGTEIITEIGDIKIEDLVKMNPMPKVLSVKNTKTNKQLKLCFSKIKTFRVIENQDTFEIYTEQGTKLNLTYEHPVYTDQKRDYTLTQDLNSDDYLINNKLQREKVLTPFASKDNLTVYDLQIENTENYFANGILVHNCLILDDLVKDRADASSDNNRRKREDWFTSTAYTRLMPDENVTNGRILLIMTRWSYNDIGAFLLNELAHENWHVLNCPAIAEDDDILGRETGEALWPEKRDLTALRQIKQSVGTDDWSALYQQRPLPKEGGLIKLNWFQRYDPHKLRFIERKCYSREPLPERLQWFNKIVISLDTAYKPKQINDPSALTVWGYSKTRQYLIEADAQKLEFPQLKRWILSFHRKYSNWYMGPVPILIEDAASGQSLIQVLRQETNVPVIAMRPDKSKLVRMEHVSDYIESGRVTLPERAKWLTDLETELAQFPYGAHDDYCDSMSQYLKWIYQPRKLRSKSRLRVK